VVTNPRPVHQRVQQADDLLLPRGGRVKLVAHPSESAAHFGKPSSTCDRRAVGYSRIALSTRVFCSRNPRISALISVTSRSAASQHSGGCRVLLAAAHSLLQFAYPCLQRRDAAFHVGWLSHDGGIPAVPPAPQSYGLTGISQFCSKVKGVEP